MSPAPIMFGRRQLTAPFVLSALSLALLWAISSAQSQPAAAPAWRLEGAALARRVRELVDPLVPRYGNAAVVVAVVDGPRESFFAFGRLDAAAAQLRKPDASSLGLGYLPLDIPAMRKQRGEPVSPEDAIGHPTGTRYTRERLAADLPHEKLSSEPGSRYAYSPLGFGLLGIALSERAGMSFPALLREVA